jgi:hypothetical protein
MLFLGIVGYTTSSERSLVRGSPFFSACFSLSFEPCTPKSGVPDLRLDVFFGRDFSISKSFDIPRFYTRLSLPLAQRPHPALLNAIYLLSANWSESAALSQLVPKFYDVAVRTIEAAVHCTDRLLDIVRAITLLTLYQFTREQFLAGYNSAGSAIRYVLLGPGCYLIQTTLRHCDVRYRLDSLTNTD